MTSPSPPTGLPSGLEGWHWLSDHGQGRRVARARLQGLPVVVRLAPAADAGESVAELAVLAAVDHPGLARRVDQGTLPDGSRYVVRGWIEGDDLLAWSAGRAPEEIGAVAARLGPALEHLHRRGFVHGDLKATNVIVRAGPHGPEPVLTDFGLARTSGSTEEGGGVSGTLFHVAPEVLLGGELTPAADLFALGAMLHQLLVGRRAGAREFYGRFPHEDFFAATGTRTEEAPEWARDLLVELLARDPARRPEGAGRLGRRLAARLGLRLDDDEATERLAWSPLTGRDAWRTSWWRRLTEGASSGEERGRVAWIRLPAGEDARSLVEALALHAALEGAPVGRLDLSMELSGHGTSAAIDAWADELATGRAGHVLLASVDAEDPWQARGIATLARAVLRRLEQGGSEGAPLLQVLSAGAPIEPELGWEVADLPALDPDEVGLQLGARLAGGEDPREAKRLRALSALLCEAAGGTATGLARALDAATRQGWFLVGDERPRLRPGRLPEHLAVGAVQATPAGDQAARTWAALHVAGGRAPLAELARLLGAGETSLAEGLDELVAGGAVALRRDAGGARVEALRRVNRGWAASLEEQLWSALNLRRAERLEASGAPGWRMLPHLAQAGRDEGVVEAASGLREEGLAELALELVDLIEGLERGRARELPPELVAERAFAWCALGQGRRAQAAAAPLEGDDTPRVRALAARVRGQVAALRHELAAALDQLELARTLDPRDGGEARLAKARLYLEARRYAEVEALLDELAADELAALAPRVRNNLRALAAVAVFRRGEIERARDLLAEQAREARAAGHGVREASLELNLATLERRAGDPAAALRHLARAVELYDAAGHLAGLAQARALRGGTLREAGRLREAEPELAAALSVRERLGDLAGASGVRGMLGLAQAERGRARPALAELERSASSLRVVGRSHDALLLEARAGEMRARLGLAREGLPVRAETQRSAEGDPRTLLALARGAWLEDDDSAARTLVARAASLGTTLGLVAVQEEAEFLADALDERWERSTGALRAAAAADSLATQDRALCGLLASAPLDVALGHELATRLEALGRDDRAARAWIGLAVRAPDEGAAQSAAARAVELLESCASGASAAEREHLERALLGLPDPWPEDLVAWRQRASGPDDLEAEVIELLDINRRLLGQEDLASLLGAIVEHALSVCGAQRGFLVLEDDGELVVDTALDSRRGGIDESDVELSGSALRQALETMQPVRVSNAVDDPLLGAAPSVIALELRSILCVPFQVDKVLRGVIYVDHRLREAAFDEHAERMLRLLADQAALAVLQVRRLEEIRRLNRELSKQVVAVESDLKTARRELIEAGLPATAGGLVGSSEPMRAVRRVLERAAPGKLAVLLSGESGTGKELAARALHELSPRAEAPFVSENCAALPASLIEAELFGARKGAYTGSDRDREGLFERAHGGTLFLDEIGELPLDLQAKLLRVLETSEVRRVGDERARRVDFRLVVATNRDLEAEVAAGRFRSDLYYRLKGLEVRMPPLAERDEDIPALVDHFLRLQEREDGVPREVSKAVLAALVHRHWPGNVRELANEVARLCVLSEGDLVDAALVSSAAQTSAPAAPLGGGVLSLAQLERAAIEHALEVTGGDKTEAAKLLGISRAKVYQRLKEWGEG